ncbi:hypothetical protein OQJ02_09550 [Legionella sp. PATHC032]|uniref:hypothetical protein n=1 Tax=Legionella sp. PATHC032 TaxID=2992039 RepID=UPI001B11D73D|nr:hypothetical protein [Legionella sp. PATHC032]MCW8421874.1 hypothetical protein [Legionella sp. PATHC032]HAZ7572163.1 hypothetical protein [Legionella pneumophila]HBA1634813.1 hypothetical protein [Legionella pneumophila]
MAYTKFFAINPYDKKSMSIYQSVKKEFEKDLEHIESSYSELLKNKDFDPLLLVEMKKLESRLKYVLFNWFFLFKKDKQGLNKEICQFKVDILRLKTKFMISHVLLNPDKYNLEHYRLVVKHLHNQLEVLNDRIGLIKGIEIDIYSDLPSEMYEWFEQMYFLLNNRYDEFKEEFSIDDVWEDWSYDNSSSGDDEEHDEPVISFNNTIP